MKILFTVNTNKPILIDDEDYEKLSKIKWYESTGIIVGGNPTTSIGRFILNLNQSRLKSEHKDRNIFNCQKNNLRVCTQSQNLCNRVKMSNCVSIYKGVSFYK